MAASLKAILARVGEEKARARAARSGPPGAGDFQRRIEASLALYEDLKELRFSRLVAELGSETAAREKMRSEEDQRAREKEEAIARLQARLYGRARKQTKE
jgi:hypothetical protein